MSESEPEFEHQSLTPVELKRVSPAVIDIRWSNGETLRYQAQRLRDACPCATCREKKRARENDNESVDGTAKPVRAMLPILAAAEAQPTTIVDFRPVGNYAYNIAFNDGHRTGIFTLDVLYELGQATSPSKADH